MVEARRYTLHEITGAMGDALKTLSLEERSEQSRVLRLFIDATVNRLKALPGATPMPFYKISADEDPFS